MCIRKWHCANLCRFQYKRLAACSGCNIYSANSRAQSAHLSQQLCSIFSITHSCLADKAKITFCIFYPHHYSWGPRKVAVADEWGSHFEPMILSLRGRNGCPRLSLDDTHNNLSSLCTWTPLGGHFRIYTVFEGCVVTSILFLFHWSMDCYVAPRFFLDWVG